MVVSRHLTTREKSCDIYRQKIVRYLAAIVPHLAALRHITALQRLTSQISHLKYLKYLKFYIYIEYIFI
jgi:hypothetical protein